MFYIKITVTIVARMAPTRKYVTSSCNVVDNSVVYGPGGAPFAVQGVLGITNSQGVPEATTALEMEPHRVKPKT